MESPSLPMDVRDINVCLLSAKKKSASSPSLRQLDNMSLCNFPTSMSVADELHTLSGESRGTIGRKRSHPDLDTQSVDISFREPSAKKARRPLSKMSHIANKIRESPLKQAKNTIKRSLSFSRERSVPSPASKYRLPSTPKQPSQSTSGSARKKKLNLSKPHLPENWVGAVVGGASRLEKYSKEEVKRQEAIWAIYRTEHEMTEDLRMIVNIFYHPMLRLGLLSEENHCKVFGNLQTILSLHEGLVSQLEELKTSDDQYFDNVGKTLLEWECTASVTLNPIPSHVPPCIYIL